MKFGEQQAFGVGSEGYIQKGITYRQWLAAHAPHEPASWFKPNMPPRPESRMVDMRGNEYQAGASQIVGANGFIEDLHDANRDAIDAWDRQRRMAYSAQWPWAWADVVLAAENGGGV